MLVGVIKVEPENIHFDEYGVDFEINWISEVSILSGA